MTAATLSVEQAADRLGVHHQALYRALREHTTDVPSTRIGRAVRIPAAPLEHFLATGQWPTGNEKRAVA